MIQRLKKILCGSWVLASVGMVCADTFQWTGAQDAFWTNAANWTVEGAVATRCPGVAYLSVQNDRTTALLNDTDTAVFAGNFSRTTINLKNLYSIKHIVISGFDTPQISFGAEKGQKLPLAWKGSFTIEDTVRYAPTLPYGIYLGKGNNGNEIQGTEGTTTLIQNCADPLHLMAYCGDTKLEGRSAWISSLVAFRGKGDLYFDCATDFQGTFNPNFYISGTVYINASLNRVRSFKIREESSGRFVLGDEGYIPFSSDDKPGIYVYRSGVTTFEGGGMSFASGHVKVCDAYTLSWGCLSGGIVQFKNCQLTSKNGTSVTPNYGMTVGVNDAMGEASNTGTFEFLNDNENVSGPLEIVDGLTIKTAKIGAPGDASPIGSGSEIWFARDGKLAYTGAGETMSRSLVITNYKSSAEGTLSQQGTGVWCVTSPISVFSSNDATLTLHNAGEIEAILSSSVPDPVVSGTTKGKTNLKKTGIGTWVIDGANTFSGDVILEDGTLWLTPNGTLGSASCLITRGGTLKIEANAPRTIYFETVRFQGGLRLEFDPTLVTVKMMSHAGREPLFLTVNGKEALVEADGTVRAKKPHEYAYDPNKWGQYPERWFYCGTQVGGSTAKEAQTNFVYATNALIHAHAAGYKAVALRYLEHILYARGYESRKYLCNYIELCDDLGVDIIPLCWNIGWCGKLDANAAEADFLENVPLVVETQSDGTRVAHVDNTGYQFFENGSFEEVSDGKAKGWSQSSKVSLDTTVSRTGNNSLKYDLTNLCSTEGDSTGYPNTTIIINAKAGEKYQVGAWFKVDPNNKPKLAKPFHIQIYQAIPPETKFSYWKNHAATYSNKTVNVENGNWEYHSFTFDVASDRNLRIYFDATSTSNKVNNGGTFWVDDAVIARLTHRREIVRREGVNFVVKNADTEVEYIEGVDYEPVPSIKSLSDDDSITAFTPELSLTLTPTSSIPNNAKLLVSYNPRVWQSHLDGNGGYCMSNPAMKREVEQCADWIYRRLNPRRWFPYVDEIRVGGSCEYCRTHYNSMAGVLSDYIKTEYNAIRKNQPNAEVIIWDDMVNPYHNAREKYELCVGSFIGVWDMIPKDIIIADWMRGSTTDENLVFRQSEEFFRTNGFRTICCTYYDATKWQEQMTNQVNIINTIPGELGIMYCSWDGVKADGYPHMQGVGDIVDDLAKPIFLTNEWAGASSGAWSGSTNWSPAMETRAVVYIPAGVTVTVDESDLIQLNKMREIIVDGTLVLNTSEAPATTITGTGTVRKMSDVTWAELPTTMDGFEGFVLVSQGTIEPRSEGDPSGPTVVNPSEPESFKPVRAYGEQYFDTPLKATGAVAAEFTMIWHDITKNQCLAGASDGAALVMLAGLRNGHWVYAMSADGSVIDTGVAPVADREYKVKVILEPNRQEFWLDGVCVATSALPDEIKFDQAFSIFALKQNGIPVQKSFASIRCAKLYQKRGCDFLK